MRVKVDLNDENTEALSDGWCLMSSSTAVPTITAFSLSIRTFECLSEVKMENMDGMTLGRFPS